MCSCTVAVSDSGGRSRRRDGVRAVLRAVDGVVRHWRGVVRCFAVVAVSITDHIQGACRQLRTLLIPTLLARVAAGPMAFGVLVRRPEPNISCASFAGFVPSMLCACCWLRFLRPSRDQYWSLWLGGGRRTVSERLLECGRLVRHDVAGYVQYSTLQ